MARDAVSHVFRTLCGKSDQEDRFTGMQQDMNSTMIQAVRTAYATGRHVALIEAKRADAGKQRLLEQHAAGSKKWMEEMLASATTQIESMCQKVEEQNKQFASTTAAMEAAMSRLRHDCDAKAREL
eukprot:CAMPEP_0172163908 /NCGR_PEP_ID=MMETSP1050-20130122/7539_1 /TAXON_ID=233186 /ORGANISM="Cryptomonas curvata, Strain CCAP979/52" /LENGTH=125 /DNA_ID=CAMNT_0012834163 /DNA_START=188 /DNA_END=562 /DNA_ORIENTATION=-